MEIKQIMAHHIMRQEHSGWRFYGWAKPVGMRAWSVWIIKK